MERSGWVGRDGRCFEMIQRDRDRGRIGWRWQRPRMLRKLRSGNKIQLYTILYYVRMLFYDINKILIY